MKGKGHTITKDKGVELCADLLFKGNGRKEILEALTKPYKVSVGCIDKWIKEARATVTARQKQAEAIRSRVSEEVIAEACKEGLLNDTEIEVILCRIISGGIGVEEWIKGEIVLRGVTPAEQTNAAKVIYAKRGSNAAPKLPKGKDGEIIQPTSITLNLG